MDFSRCFSKFSQKDQDDMFCFVLFPTKPPPPFFSSSIFVSHFSRLSNKPVKHCCKSKQKKSWTWTIFPQRFHIVKFAPTGSLKVSLTRSPNWRAGKQALGAYPLPPLGACVRNRGACAKDTPEGQPQISCRYCNCTPEYGHRCCRLSRTISASLSLSLSLSLFSLSALARLSVLSLFLSAALYLSLAAHSLPSLSPCSLTLLRIEDS
jgi:hypothetical protein